MADNFNVWNMYGLKGNPFTTDALSVYGDDFPIEDTFIGREKEVNDLIRIVHSNKTSRMLIYGDIGIGKTTYANFVKYRLTEKDGYFTPLGELSIQYSWTPEEFMLYTIGAIYTTLDRKDDLKTKIKPELLQKLNIICGTERGFSAGAGISAFGSGISGESSKSFGVPLLNSHTLKLLFQDLLDEIKKIGYKGTIIHYNNLELIQDKGENQLKKILNGMRDFLQVNGCHFLFVSDKKLYEIFQQIPRVEDIFQTPILLKPFSIGEVEIIIEKRIKILKISNINPIIPFDDESLNVLFKLYNGNLRGILKSLECSINEIVGETSRAIKVNANLLKFSLHKFAQRRLLDSLGGKEDTTTIRIFRRILEKRETTNKLLAEHFKMRPQNVSTSLTVLRESGQIKLSRTEGQSRYYVPSQDALWLLLEPTPDWNGQTQISLQ